MKKLLYLLLVLPFAMLMASCSDDDNLPDVQITMNFSNAAVDDGVLYVAKNDTLKLNSIVTKAMDANQSATLANVRYFWNYIPAPSLTWSNFPLEIDIDAMPLTESGMNYLGMQATLLETDKSMAYTNIQVPIKVVETVEEFPAGQEPGDVQLVLQVGQSRDQGTNK